MVRLDKITIEEIIKIVRHYEDTIEHNRKIYNILEGDLGRYVRDSLEDQFSGDSADLALKRSAPINILKKLISELTKIYSSGVERKTNTPSDQEIIDDYVDRGIDGIFHEANKYFNAAKASSVELYENTADRRLDFRVSPPHTSLALNFNRLDTMVPEVIVKIMGDDSDELGNVQKKIWIYTPDEFAPVFMNGDIAKKDLQDNEGINPYSVLPFEYVVNSKTQLTPPPDSDILQMTILIPVLLTDMNFGSMFLSAPQIYGIDVDDENVKKSPNSFLNFKSNQVEGGTPKVGVIDASPDLDMQMNNALGQLTSWLQTRDVKVEGIGSVNGTNFASGVARIISKMDTIENRNQQKVFFKDFEKRFWKRLAKIHNYLVDSGSIDDMRKFSDPDSLIVSVKFSEEQIFESRDQKLKRLSEEVASGFNSRVRALAEYHGISADEAAALLEEIAGDRGSIILEEDESGAAESEDKDT